MRAFLAEQDEVQGALRERIGPGPELDAWAWAGYRLLQTWDVMSLFLTWGRLWDRGEVALPQTPRAVGDPGVEIRLRRDGDAVACGPWPFRDDAVDLPVAARTVPARPYASGADLAAEITRCPAADPRVPPAAGVSGASRQSVSYLNERLSRARYCSTLPSSSIVTSSLVTSATRRSRSEPLAVATALAVASSHDVSLVPMTSMTRYTLLAMSGSSFGDGLAPAPYASAAPRPMAPSAVSRSIVRATRARRLASAGKATCPRRASPTVAAASPRASRSAA